MLVTRSDLTPSFVRELGQHIKRSLFVSFDLEFTGLAQKVDFLDTVEERYTKLKTAAQTCALSEPAQTRTDTHRFSLD